MVDKVLAEILRRYADEVVPLSRSASTNEESYYPAVRALVADLLRASGLSFRVWVGTSEVRDRVGRDRPDLGIYDEAGEYLVVPGEVKRADVDLATLAVSTEREDQIGRYLAQTGIVLISNIRALGLVALRPGAVRDRGRSVPPEDRDLLGTVAVWPSAEAMEAGDKPALSQATPLREMVERAVTEFAPIADPASLASLFARQARSAKADLPARFEAVAGLLEDYGVALGLTFEGEEGQEFFRSSLIQTAFYGLFAGWTVWHLRNDGTEFGWERLERYLEIPFLAELFYEFRHPTRLDELHLAPHLDRAALTLARVDRDAFFRRFLPAAPDTTDSDHLPALASAAITYFYEPFLEAFDPDLRKELGVWYTPPEVVQYQVRRIDQLLRTELGVARGLADDEVVVLDPCCGTGAYLLEVVRVIAEQLYAEGEAGTMGSYLLDAVCQRVLGFEILTAPFVIAQLQLYLLLAALGVPPTKKRRPAVFLTNALTGWDGPEQIKLNFPELQTEHDAAQHVKRDARIIVILGNPPYNRFAGAPVREEADLADHYKGIKRNAKGQQVGQSELFVRWGVRKHLLDDLYIRFFRLAERQIGEKAHYGIVSFISNSSFLAGRSHPLMRESLLTNFHAVWIDNMHGNRLASERTPWGDSCETLFSVDLGAGIKVGTSITTWLKQRDGATKPESTTVAYRDFWGRAEAKRLALLESLTLEKRPDVSRRELAGKPAGPRGYEIIAPTAASRWLLAPGTARGGYEDWPGLDELFPDSFMGVHTGKDGGVIALSRQELEERFRAYTSETVSDEQMQSLCPTLMQPANEFNDPIAFRRAVIADPQSHDPELFARPYLFRPLDPRVIWYDTTRRSFASHGRRWSGQLVQRYGVEFKSAISVRNEFLLAVPQPRRTSETKPLFCRTLADLHVHDRGTVGFPAIVTPAAPISGGLFTGSQRAEQHANVARPVWAALGSAWGLPGDESSNAALDLVRQLFRVALAVLHAPQYQHEHRESLAMDWSHVPIPKSREAFDRIAAVGKRIATLLDAEADPAPVLRDVLPKQGRTLAMIATVGSKPVLPEHLAVSVSYFGAATGRWIERPCADGEERIPGSADLTGDLFINTTVAFRNVPKAVWRYELGGYPVLKKWLGYRQANRRDGRPLTLAEAKWFRGIVQRLAALIAMTDELDAAYRDATNDPFTRDELGLE